LADALTWADEDSAVDLLEVCRTEIERHEHLAPSLSHSFDRFDLLKEAAAGWRLLRQRGGVPRELLQLLAASWSRPFGEVRSPLVEVLHDIARAPRGWLDHLDEIHEHAPATLALFGELLDQFEQTQDAVPIQPCSQKILTDLILGFLPQLNAADYPDERSRLLAFCLREAIAPEEMAEAAHDFTGGWERLGIAWGHALLHDWPLRYICWACRLFWA